MRSHIGARLLAPDDSVAIAPAFTDLDGDGEAEAIVYVSGESQCGSGGCNTYILARRGDSYRVVTQLTISWPPIRLLPGRSRGWRNIGVVVAGGGIRPAYEAALRFDGETYPINPSVPPARPSPPGAPGEVLIAEPDGIALFG